MQTSISSSSLVEALRERVAAEGLDILKVTSAHLPPEVGGRLRAFVSADHHGDMGWMEERVYERSSPDHLWPAARSAILLGLNYNQGLDPLKRLEDRRTGVIAQYALNRDYHDLFKSKLKRLAHWFHEVSSSDVKIFVDTAPLMEKPLAQQAGLGWQGKHTNLVSRDLGSWFFIGSILTTATLPFDEPESDHCGSCQACLDICPTKAFPEPRRLDARRCISYLTIEHKGPISREFRKAIGNRIYGCDDCLGVCPWNKFANASREMKLAARAELVAPDLYDLLQLDDGAFRKLFSASPVKRTGRNRFIRNCLIAAGNSGEQNLVPIIVKLLDDSSNLVRGMAVWALRELVPFKDFDRLRVIHLNDEFSNDVIAEWNAD